MLFTAVQFIALTEGVTMKVKLGFIGCGGIANAHMHYFKNVEEAEFAAMCDIDKAKAEKASAAYGGKVYTDFRKMLDETKIDACVICVPPFAHKGQEEECIERGLPFLVEKPVHLEIESAHGIAAKVRKANLITSAGYVLRYFDVVDMAKEMIGKEQVSFALGKYFGDVPGGGEGWYSQKSLSGGQLVEQATHILDMMRYFLGEVEEVFAYKTEGINGRIYKKYDVEDTSTLLLKFKNGCAGNLTCTWLWTGFASSLEVVGKDVIMNYSRNTLTVESPNKKVTHMSSLDPMQEEDRAFVKAVMHKDASFIKSDYEDAVRTLDVSLKAHESIRTGKPVRI